MNTKIIPRDVFCSVKKNFKITEDPELELVLKKFFLKNTFNVWRHQYKSPIFKTDLNDIDKKKNQIKSLFNKLSNSNFEQIKNKLMYICTDDELIEYALNYIFEIATKQKMFCKKYVELIQNFISKDQKYKAKITNIIHNYKDINKNSSIKNNKDLSYDDFCENNKLKVYKEGYSQFIGELYIQSLIDYSIVKNNIDYMLKYLDILLKNDDVNQELVEEMIICINQLIITTIDKIKPADLSFIFNYLTFFCKNKKISKRLIFKLMDLKDKVEPLVNVSTSTPT